MAANYPASIIFDDLKDRNQEQIDQLEAKKGDLENQKKTNNNSLPFDLEQQLKEIVKELKRLPKIAGCKTPLVDDLFFAVKEQLTQLGMSPDDHCEGQFNGGIGPLTAADLMLAGVYGILDRDGNTYPKAPSFTDAISLAIGEYNANLALFMATFPYIVQAGTINGGAEQHVRCDQWALVVQALVQQGIKAGDSLLAVRTLNALAAAAGTTDGAPPSSISIDLPDLEAQTDVVIQTENLKAMEAIFFVAQVEELHIFNVVEKLVELFQLGVLPIGKGRAGDLLYAYWRKAVQRMTEVERRNLYARCFGLPGGDATMGNPNREFKDLWIRFISAVSTFVRQYTVDGLIRSQIPVPVSQEMVRKAGNDLGANLSLHGYGVAYFAATDLQTQLRDAIDILGDQGIKNAYGSRDMWQVIDQVTALELNSPPINNILCRTRANSGAIIIRWIANNATKLSKPGRVDILNLNLIRMGTSSATLGQKVTNNPTDADLVDACDQWLAVTGTTDTQVEQYSQPTEAPAIPTRPIQIPSVARDLLQSVGVSTNGLVKA